MRKIQIAPRYALDYLETNRPQPLTSNELIFEIQNILNGSIDKNITNEVYSQFKIECRNWLLSSTVNQLHGLNNIPHVDIIIGCTQFIDNVYMQGIVQTFENDYRYHERLGLSKVVSLGKIIPDIPLIIALPFPSIGAEHPDMSAILDECYKKDVPVFIDAAWYTCCKDINFDLTHPAIHSIGISLSKGLGLGWNRVGLRFSKKQVNDSISIMNNFDMNNKVLVKIGLHFIRKFPADYLWKYHADRHEKVCKDFNLTPTKSNYIALLKGQPVGISPLIRYLENENT